MLTTGLPRDGGQRGRSAKHSRRAGADWVVRLRFDIQDRVEAAPADPVQVRARDGRTSRSEDSLVVQVAPTSRRARRSDRPSAGGITCREAAVHQRPFGIDLSRCSRQLSAASRGIDSPTLPQLRHGLTVLWLSILRPRSSGDAPGCARLRNPRERPTPSPAQLAMYGRTRHTHYPEGMQTKRPLQRVVTKCQRTVAEGRDSAGQLGGQSSWRATPEEIGGISFTADG